MQDSCSSIPEMVADIAARLPALDGNRRQMLFRWLQAHHVGTQITDASLTCRLTEWFSRVPPEGRDWEYRLILSEITWWRDLDEPALAEFMALEGPADS